MDQGGPMKILISIFTAMILPSVVWAVKADNLPGYAVMTQVKFEKAGATHQVDSEVVIDKKQKEWVKVGELGNQLFVFSRILGEKNGIIDLEYKVVDRSKGQEKILERTALVGKSGLPIEIEVDGKSHKLVIASKTSSIYYMTE